MAKKFEFTKQLALKTLLCISIAGVLFSGYLSYSEIFKQVCPIGGCSTTILSLPACVYGLVMYLISLIVAVVGLKTKK